MRTKPEIQKHFTASSPDDYCMDRSAELLEAAKARSPEPKTKPVNAPDIKGPK